MEFLLNLGGGIALLLWGIRMVRTGMNRSFGAELRRALAVSNRSRLAAFAAGASVTAVLQSSTATALIVAPFAARGIFTGAAALAIMLGADVGTTLAVQVLSLGVSWLSPLLILSGVTGFLSSRTSKPKGLARAAIGLGLALLALHLITAASEPLRSSDLLAVIVAHLSDQPVIAVLLAAVLTWLSHSSVAVVLLIMSLAAGQIISEPLALALVLGANLGGAMVAVVLTANAPPANRRVPIGNMAMRAIGTLLALALLPYLFPYLDMLHTSPARLVVNFHTGFNLALAVLFLPLVGWCDRLIGKLLPDKGEGEKPAEPRYLDAEALDTPSVALACATREALRMGDHVQQMLAASMDVFRRDDERKMREIEEADDVVDRLHEAIKLYLAQLTREELDARESNRSLEIMSFTTNLEHIGDIIDKNLMELAAKKMKARATFSKAGMAELEAFHKHVLANFELAMNVFTTGDLELARRLLREKTEIRQLEQRSMTSHFSRIGEGRAESIHTSALHIDVLRDLKRINSHLTSVAYPILERAGELAETRLVSLRPQAGAAMEPVAGGTPEAEKKIGQG